MRPPARRALLALAPALAGCPGEGGPRGAGAELPRWTCPPEWVPCARGGSGPAVVLCAEGGGGAPEACAGVELSRRRDVADADGGVGTAFYRASDGRIAGGWRAEGEPGGPPPATFLPEGGDGDSGFLPDFSYAGYHRGERRPPVGVGTPVVTVDGALGDGTRDATAGVQSAIDMACARGGGGVRIPAGLYRVRLPSDTAAEAIRIACSRVVLRGDGPTTRFCPRATRAARTCSRTGSCSARARSA